MTRRRVAIALLLLLALAGAVFGGYRWGFEQGRAAGFRRGVRYGEARALREGPPPVRDRAHTEQELRAAGAFDGLAPAEGEAGRLAGVLNRAPSPCPRQARRGISLATSLLEGRDDCPAAIAQVGLGYAALRTFGDAEEALAVLRVERRVPIVTEGRAARGPADAAVTIVEFSDFQCPYCARSQDLVEEVLEQNPGVRLVFKHLPLRFHPAAVPAALASEAARRQDRFWEMHDLLFAAGGKKLQAAIDPEVPVPADGPVYWEDLAGELGLDVEQYRRDFRSEALRALVDEDLKEARALGVDGTPTFFVGGRKVEGPRSPELFARLIAKAEAEREGRFSWDLEPPPKGVAVPEPGEPVTQP